jgi:amino acid adenylation domain-containing protein
MAKRRRPVGTLDSPIYHPPTPFAMSVSDFRMLGCTPDQRSALDFRPDLQQLLTWNQTEQLLPVDCCLHHAIQAQAELTPGAIAVECGQQHLTYAELNRQANWLAYALQGQGVGPEVYVGVCMERSLDLIVTLLAVLKAGGAYVPLDPDSPPERLHYMLQDSGVRLVVTQAKFYARSLEPSGDSATAPDSSGTFPILIVEPLLAATPEAVSNPISPVSPHHPIYLIYTSGSTGRPKGVVNLHQGVANRLWWMLEQGWVQQGDRVLQKTPFSFDVSVWELFAPLMVGACLVVAKPGGHRDSSYLKQLMIEHCITMAHFVPSMLGIFLDQDLTDCTSLQRVLCSGEALPRAVVNRFFQQLDCRLHNLYGPTEASIEVTAWDCATCEDEAAPVPIGHAIANTQIYLLDQQLQPVAQGEAGELHIGGIGLARGYHNRPDLTAEKFIALPESLQQIHPPTSPPRLYKTGDLARRLTNGAIEYLGRLDHQVKIRGLRIELGEIEAAILQQDGIKAAVVVASPDQQLIAYCVRETAIVSDAPEIASKIQQALARQLPDYMLPAHWVWLADLPLNPNGKIDRNALPPVGTIQQGPLSRPSHSPLEHQVALIWQQVLGWSVGAEDDFFAIGGNSLTATQVVARMQREFGANRAPSLEYFFAQPTVAAIAAALESRREEVAPRPDALSLSPRPNPSNTAELSFAQQRLWFLDQLQPNSPLYNLPVLLKLEGEIQFEALDQALSALVERHSTLRTTFDSTEGLPYQRIHPPYPLQLRRLHLDRDAKLKGHLHAEALWPFDINRDEMLRATYIQTPTSQFLLLVVHHIAADGWSLGLIQRDLAAFYQGFTRNQPAALPALPIDYADFSVWQRHYLQGQLFQTQLHYWQEQLQGCLPVMDLPMARSRPAIQSFKGAQHAVQLSGHLTQQIQKLASQEGATLFMVLLANYQHLLHKYTQLGDILVGVPIANRNQLETENLVGFFVNTLVLRTRFDASGGGGDGGGAADAAAHAPGDLLSFRRLLKQVRQVALDAYAHQDMPFEKLVELLHPERDLSRNPLVQVAFAFQNLPNTGSQWGDLTVQRQSLEHEPAKFDLTLEITENIVGSGLSCNWTYNPDLFYPESIQQLAQHFQILLENCIASPDQALAQIPMLSPQEWQQQRDWNRTQVPYDSGCVQQIFEQWAERTPEATALVDGASGRSWSYDQLNQAANQLAHYLQSHNLQSHNLQSHKLQSHKLQSHKLQEHNNLQDQLEPTQATPLVAVYLERSPQLVITLLAILKAGAAYLPIDTSYPAERVQQMLQDAQVVITNGPSGDRLTSIAQPLHCLNLDANPQASYPQTNPVCNKTNQDLAYVLYTSGSTGRPKGVMVPHRGVTRLVLNQNYIQVSPRDVVSQCCSSSFDAATFEIWAPLLNGAQLVVVPQSRVLDAASLAQLFQTFAVSITLLPTALFNHLVEGNASLFSGLRYVLFGGEAADGRWVRAVQASGYSGHLLNVYGPTENTTFSTVEVIEPLTERAVSTPIGWAVANSQVFVLNQAMQPVPVGVTGELYVGGDGLALGYWGQPELSAQKFIPLPQHLNPLDPQECSPLLYRTGDLVKADADGRLHFLGRRDDQIKLRGFRIELAEIEAAISQYSTVQSATVLLQDVPQRGPTLVAYLVLAGELRGLQQFLQAKLPSYMVPGKFVRLEHLPLTPNGKIDKAALAARPLNWIGPKNEQRLQVVRDSIETELMAIWRGLRLEVVRGSEDFFDLGGHSLLAVRLFAQIEQRFGCHLPLATLFQAPTVVAIARLIRERSAQTTPAPSAAPHLVEIQAGSPDRAPIFCLHGAGGEVLFYRELIGRFDPQQSFYGIQAGHILAQNPNSDLPSIPQLAQHYIEILRDRQPQGPYHLMGYSIGALIAYEMAQQLRASGDTVAWLALIDPSRPGGRRLSQVQKIPDLPRWLDRQRLEQLAYRAEYHLSYLQQLERSQQLSYLGRQSQRLSLKLQTVLRRSWATGESGASGAPGETGATGAIPPQTCDLAAEALQSVGALRFHHYMQMVQTYTAQPYPDKLHLFLSQQIKDNLGHWGLWQRLAQQELELHTLAGNHLDIVQQYQAQPLAIKLADTFQALREGAVKI